MSRASLSAASHASLSTLVCSTLCKTRTCTVCILLTHTQTHTQTHDRPTEQAHHQLNTYIFGKTSTSTLRALQGGAFPSYMASDPLQQGIFPQHALKSSFFFTQPASFSRTLLILKYV